jgi:hypothetical protein
MVATGWGCISSHVYTNIVEAFCCHFDEYDDGQGSDMMITPSK